VSLLPEPPAFLARQSQVRQRVRAAGLDALLVSSLPNITYLSGFEASAALALLTPERLWLVSDGRYAGALTARAAVLAGTEARLVEVASSYETTLASVVAEAGVSRLGFESEHLTVRRFRWFETALGPTVELHETHELVERERALKDSWEQATLREAAGRLSEAAKCILANALAGMVERDVAARIDVELRRAGFSRPAFDSIVASGPNAALPHHRAGTKRVERGELVLLDFGGIWQGYAVDLSRTLVAGASPTPVQRAWIEAVAAAQRAAIETIRPGVAPEAVDEAARGQLERAGLGDFFVHGTGHGLGLEVHELPRIGRRRADRVEPPLAAGMVCTVEPGVYVPDQGGVRIEDDVLVTMAGCEVLTWVPWTM
jgi:Xaa-Pro aminopeptidase